MKMANFISSLFVSTLLVLTALPSFAQTNVDPAADSTPELVEKTATLAPSQSCQGRTTYGLQMITWIEKIKLSQGGNTVGDNANFYGTALTLDHEFTHDSWGYGPMLAVMSGRGSSGGNNFLNYIGRNVAWHGGLIGARAFYRWSPQIATGIQLPVIYRKITWPTVSGVKIDSGDEVNYSLLFELKMQFNLNWEMTQALGPHSAGGGSLWRAGISRTW